MILNSASTSPDDRPARAARDVKPGESWVFREHRTIAELDRIAAYEAMMLKAEGQL